MSNLKLLSEVGFKRICDDTIVSVDRAGESLSVSLRQAGVEFDDEVVVTLDEWFTIAAFVQKVVEADK